MKTCMRLVLAVVLFAGVTAHADDLPWTPEMIREAGDSLAIIGFGRPASCPLPPGWGGGVGVSEKVSLQRGPSRRLFRRWRCQ